jgi:alkaline phosphatase D
VILFAVTCVGLLLCPDLLGAGTAAAVTFTHGVASGEVRPFTAVLWTRVDQETSLTVEGSTDPSFHRLSFRHTVHASAAADFTAQATVLVFPQQTYYYRWRYNDVLSDVGTFTTPPLPGTARDVRFVFSGDSDGTKVHGVPAFNNFEVLDAVRAEHPDFFVYLGDTIYADSEFRSVPATTLAEYRDAYKENRDYPALRNLLKATSLYAIWDDHEVRDDFAGQTVDPLLYANGRQAFLEYLPLRPLPLPQDPTCAGTPLFRVFHWGKDVDIIILDERSCRSAEVSASCQGDLVPTLPAPVRAQFAQSGFPLPAQPPAGCLQALFDPTRTMLGPLQKALFKAALLLSTAKFKFVINEVPIQQFYGLPYDRWEGYGAERAEILGFIQALHIKNVIFLTTDTHANLINEVFLDHFLAPTPVAYEFVTGPIATDTFMRGLEATAANLHVTVAQVVQAFNGLLDLVGVDCRNFDTYSYGVVEVQDSAGTASITLKDNKGNLVHDQFAPGIVCRKILGP